MNSTLVKEQLKVVIANIDGNLKQIDNNIAQLEQQLSVMKDQKANATTLLETLHHVLAEGEAMAEAVLNRLFKRGQAEAQVASSPSQPAAAEADAAAAGSAGAQA